MTGTATAPEQATHSTLQAANKTMTNQQGQLTAAQLEIMEVIWQAPQQGVSVAEIWETISQQRQVARTTILTLVSRLEERQWLKRERHGGVWRYVAQQERQEAMDQLAAQFVDEYFQGSSSALIKSLLGAKRITGTELRRVKNLLDQKKKGT